MKSPENLLWVDFETTGLMGSKYVAPLEVAAIVTDKDLNELAVFGSVALRPPGVSLAEMNDFVRSMHTRSGLLARVDAEGVRTYEADLSFAEFVGPFFPQKREMLEDGTIFRGAVVAGSSVKFDHECLTRWFPETSSWLDYRMVDVSGVGELVKRWQPSVYEARPKKLREHTALADIRESIAELRFYHDNWSL